MPLVKVIDKELVSYAKERRIWDCTSLGRRLVADKPYLYIDLVDKWKVNFNAYIAHNLQYAKLLMMNEEAVNPFASLLSYKAGTCPVDEKQKEFLDRIFRRELVEGIKVIVNKEEHKRNTLWLSGPPSSGKSFILNWIGEKLVSGNIIMNKTKQTEYVWDSLLECTVGLIDECWAVPFECDEYKALFSGTPVHINQKYQPKQKLSRTPLIIASNYNTVQRNIIDWNIEKQFNTRIIKIGMGECMGEKGTRYISADQVSKYLSTRFKDLLENAKERN